MENEEQPLPDVPEYPAREMLAMEKELLGLYISGHPLKEYEDILRERVSHKTAQLAELTDETPVIIGGVVAGMRKIITRKGEPMAFVVLEDLLGSVEAVVFPRIYRDNQILLKPDAPLLIRGRVNFNTRDEEVKIIAEQVSGLDEKPAATLYLKVSETGEEDLLAQIKAILLRYRGNNPVVLYFEQRKKVIRTTREWWVDTESGVITELVQLLGEEAVCLKD